MIGVIIGSRKMGINPDNVATPIAASLGDLITLALLSGISWGLYKELGEEQQKAFVSPWSLCLLQHLPCVSPCSFTLNPPGASKCQELGSGSVGEGSFGCSLLYCQHQLGVLSAELQLYTVDFLPSPLHPPSLEAGMQRM